MKWIKRIIFPTLLLGIIFCSATVLAAKEDNDNEITGGKITFYETSDSKEPSTSNSVSSEPNEKKVLPKTGESHSKSGIIFGGLVLITVSTYGVYRYKEGKV